LLRTLEDAGSLAAHEADIAIVSLLHELLAAGVAKEVHALTSTSVGIFLVILALECELIR